MVDIAESGPFQEIKIESRILLNIDFYLYFNVVLHNILWIEDI